MHERDGSLAPPCPVARYSMRDETVPSGTMNVGDGDGLPVTCDRLNSGSTASTFFGGLPGVITSVTLTFQPPSEPLTRPAPSEYVGMVTCSVCRPGSPLATSVKSIS